MDKIIVNGGTRLDGELCVGGMKNSALPIIYSSILVPHECVIKNVPRVSDVFNSLEILRSMGAYAQFCDEHTVAINTKELNTCIVREELVCSLRASSYLLGAMLSRFGEVEMPMPGGCNLGARPLDIHIKGFETLGADAIVRDGRIKLKAKKLKCNKIPLDKISVGATINMVLAACRLDGETVIQNCALEPHVDDVIAFLNKCGARIKRCGNNIACQGVSSLCGCEHTLYPDMIEALTYVSLVGICKGRLLVYGSEFEHIDGVIERFCQMGMDVTRYQNCFSVKAERVMGCAVKTAPYPGFPTDLHPQLAALLCFSENGGVITDTVFPTRFAYVDELKKMGAQIEKNGNSVAIMPAKLQGASLDATDLRAGAALVLASLGADGQSTINNVNYIVRGYESMVEKISAIGGKIKLIKGE